jgi:hypothetical protein
LVQVQQGPPSKGKYHDRGTEKKTPVELYYYSEDEWNRLGCGPLPPERDRARQLRKCGSKGNPKIDGKNIKGYN